MTPREFGIWNDLEALPLDEGAGGGGTVGSEVGEGGRGPWLAPVSRRTAALLGGDVVAGPCTEASPRPGLGLAQAESRARLGRRVGSG